MSPKKQRWLKIIHIFLAALWLASGLTLVLLSILIASVNGRAVHGMNLAMKIIDDFIIIPAANGCLLTGIVYGIWTRWGFFRHRWVLVKWLITLYGVVVGTFFLGPWMNSMASLAGKMGAAALSYPPYTEARELNILFGGIQAATLVFATIISVLRPWKKPTYS